MDILWFILIGIVAGWLAGLIVKGRGFGLIGDLIVGVLGAIIGGYLLPLINVDLAGTIGKLVTAVIGAVVLLLILRLFRRGP